MLFLPSVNEIYRLFIIWQVNEREICEMTHQEAVKFLRDCDDEVVLTLRRDTLSSSLTSLSSSHMEDSNRTLRLAVGAQH